MRRTERRDALAAEMPPELRAVMEREIAAGNLLLDFEIGRDDRAGQTLLVMEHPFRAPREPLPAGVIYRELLDREPMVFEFVTPDGKWSLATVKLKPRKLPPLPVPVDHAAEHAERLKRREEAEAAAPAARAREATTPVPAPVATPAAKPTDPAERFLASMPMDFDKWHDGTGYDLDALRLVPADRRPAIEAMLLAKQPVDWRDIEALAQFDTPAARAAVLAAATHADPHVRRTAMSYLATEAAEVVDPGTREARLIANLRGDELLGGLGAAIDEAAEFHPPAVVDALIRGALNRPGAPAVHFAALLYFIHGKASEAFDWSHRPFFLRFDGSDGRNSHRVAFRDLCATIGVDPATYGVRD